MNSLRIRKNLLSGFLAFAQVILLAQDVQPRVYAPAPTGLNVLTPLYTFQLHASYEFRGGIWIAASTRQSLGGVVTVDDGDPLDPESNNRVGLALSIPVGRRYFIKLLGTTGVTASVGNDYNTLGLAWQVVF